jgi:transposase
MKLAARYKSVIDLDVHQTQITDCALIEEPDGTTRIEGGSPVLANGIVGH